MMKVHKKNKKLLIIGDSAFAEVAYECFTYDSEYEVVGFAVEAAFRTKDTLFGLPIINLEDAVSHYNPEEVEFYAALVYTNLNRLRTRLYSVAKEMGYKAASYISSAAFIWRNVELGEHCFVFENNTLQPFVKIANNVVLWSGNHIGHHSMIQENCFVASQVVISGFCTIERSSFIGVNVSIGNNVRVAEDNWIGPGVILTSDTEANQLYKVEKAIPSKVSAKRFFKVGS
jgi:sugar O-acyltransferase (sialic acid O-acetyltransferase NeuD family)